jgi:hypothetical protein
VIEVNFGKPLAVCALLDDYLWQSRFYFLVYGVIAKSARIFSTLTINKKRLALTHASGIITKSARIFSTLIINKKRLAFTHNFLALISS